MDDARHAPAAAGTDDVPGGVREHVLLAGPVVAGSTERVRLAVTDAGPQDGDPVLLLHGFPDSRRLWRHQVRSLATAGHRVLVPDLRGYGDSDAPERVEAYRLGRVLEDLDAVLDELTVPRAVVVGHDWGSVVAWALAGARPDRVRALVAVSVGHPRVRPAGGAEQAVRGLYVPVFLVPGVAERLLPLAGWWLLRRGAWAGAGVADDPDLARQVEDLSRPGRLTAALSWYRANIRLPRPGPPRLPRPRGGAARAAARSAVTCPVMGVWSTDDPALVERQMTASERVVEGPWRYECLIGVDHWVPVHAPEALDRVLLDFLRGLDGLSGGEAGARRGGPRG